MIPQTYSNYILMMHVVFSMVTKLKCKENKVPSPSTTRIQNVQHVCIQSVGDYSQNSNGNKKRTKTTTTNNVKSYEFYVENFL